MKLHVQVHFFVQSSAKKLIESILGSWGCTSLHQKAVSLLKTTNLNKKRGSSASAASWRGPSPDFRSSKQSLFTSQKPCSSACGSSFLLIHSLCLSNSSFWVCATLFSFSIKLQRCMWQPSRAASWPVILLLHPSSKIQYSDSTCTSRRRSSSPSHPRRDATVDGCCAGESRLLMERVGTRRGRRREGNPAEKVWHHLCSGREGNGEREWEAAHMRGARRGGGAALDGLAAGQMWMRERDGQRRRMGEIQIQRKARGHLYWSAGNIKPSVLRNPLPSASAPHKLQKTSGGT